MEVENNSKMSKISQDYIALYEFLMDKNIEHQTFETMSGIVQKKFNKNDYLSVGTLLSMLIRHGDLPGIIQKVSAYYIIYDLFRSDGQTESPFLPFFFTVLEQNTIPTRLNIIEKNFLSQLLGNGTKELAKLTPAHILKTDSIPLQVDLFTLKEHVIGKQHELPATVKAGLMNTIPGPTAPSAENPIKELMEGLALSSISPLKNTFAPQFMSVAPPLLPFEDELAWFDLTNRAYHMPEYDASNSIGVEAKKLIIQAFKQALNLGQQFVLLEELNKDPNLVYQIGLTPAKLPDLVENNPIVSVEILQKLINSMQITEYFNILVNMDITLHSIEVVNRLTRSIDLPTEFIHLYISNCISKCEAMKDERKQLRLVRLVCVFLQSLIRNKMINVKELFIEIEAFCVEFSRVKEAAALYRLVKQVEIGEGAVGTQKPKE